MKLGTKEISGRFTIPSGIVTTNVSVLKKIADEIPEIGILTTKSIGPKPREGNREPIFAQYAPDSFTNAVGLTNPGAEEFAKQLQNLKIHKDKFLLTSIFGANLEEFVYVAETLAPFSDGLELNFSCPHAQGYGQVIGQDKELVSKIISAITNKTDIPIFAKLSPNIPNLGEISKACANSGAYGITAINTAGPGYHMVNGHPVLTNELGGLSGKAILPIGLKCVKEISEAVNSLEKKIKIIACGGISTAQDIRNYEAVGANFFGVGSALKGLDLQELKLYFSELGKDLQQNTDNAVRHLKSDNSMGFVKYKIKKKTDLADDLTILEFNDSIKAYAGQFIFLWLPSIGEKPFSVLNSQPFTVLIQDKGCFTKALLGMKEGEAVYARGPHGKRTKPLQPENDLVLIGGGTGIASLYLIAKENKDLKVYIFLGARDKTHLAYIDQFEQLGNVFISTEDGSLGFKGNIVELLKEHLEKGEIKNPVFYNCGPKGMIKALTALEEQYSNKEQIYSSIDYLTKCGIGICGSCATEDGRRSCVDGTFLIK
ncbi:MAG: dihydroorotate dehydrogenase [Candidatus Woesearchaeota archaeon]|jgi:dihydroorotate dehydrogenase (NAD+) catalytic subunit|nr:dihydroorotate dehydrogenase [Candidatus Woesearchaeota archaeon]MDP7506170.1 dihydroorotate dehydrogenase [Candidatus Woesearchaeota archaeon]|tara:strand:+ start:794 stop:2419 length:1626 start_codon:yes stop_codon:yes gene_type:complete